MRETHCSLLLLGLSLGLFLQGCKTCDAEIVYDEEDPHRVQVIWKEGTDGTVAIRYAPDDREAAATTEGRQHTASLWGLPALSTIDYEVLVDGEATCSDTFTSRGLSADLPDVAAPVYQPEQADDWRYLVGVAMGEEGTLLILDRYARWVWHLRHDPGLTVSAVTLADDQLVYNSFDQDRSNDIGQITLQPLLGSTDEARSIRTEGAHHTFAYLPDGAVTFPAIDVRPWTDPDTGETVQVVGDKLVEIAADGTERVLWSIWDHETPVKHDAWDSGFYSGVGQDWTHANGLNYSAERDSYLLSLGHLDTIYELDRATGAVRLRITTDWVAEGGTPYNFQHDPNWTADGTLILLSYPEEGGARAIEYAVDAEAERLEEVWSYVREDGGTSLLGQARRLDNGNTFINFGGMGEIREVTPAGEVVWQLNAGLGTWFGNSLPISALPDLDVP